MDPKADNQAGEGYKVFHTTFSEYKCSSGVALEVDGEGSLRRRGYLWS